MRRSLLPMEQDFPFFIHKWIHRPSDKSLRSLHCRDFWKIVYVIFGSADLDINGKRYAIESGSVLFVHPNDVTNYCICSEEMRIYNLCFMPDFIADRLRYLDNSHNFFSIFAHDFVMNPDLARIFYIQSAPASIHRLFRAFYAEYRANQINREEIIRAMLFELLIRLQRLGLKNYLGNKHANAVLVVRDYISNNFTGNINLGDLAKHVGMSRSRLCTVFKSATGHCISEELLTFRLNQAQEMLAKTSIPISDVCFQCGFNDVSYFYRKFHEHFNTTPRMFRQNQNGKSS
ncbi:MAG: AraC family transcriptional regulator [Victivallales bacterium]|nr:AraC family transcriptional regulator [Victivallales bacterium]